MKKVVLLFLLLQFSLPAVLGQTAKFFADTTLLKRYAGSQAEIDRAKEMQWIINGKALYYNGDTVEIIPDKTVLDTIFFKQNAKANWDTIICNITQPKTYKIVYNTCCGAFDVHYKGKRTQGKLEAKVKGVNNSLYLARLGETGKILEKNDKKLISPMCRSVMKPNIYWVSLQQVVRCNDTGCFQDEELCLQTNEGEVAYNFNFMVFKTITRFLYLPLDDKPLRISYTPEKNKLKIK